LLAALMMGSIATVATVAAQDATPTASPAAPSSAQASGATSADPAVGTAVSYVGNDGNEIAQITAEQVIDPFKDYDSSFGGPDRGNRYVAIQVTVTATGDKALEVSSFDFALQDEQGFIAGSPYVSRTDEQEKADPEFEDTNLAPGDSVSGLLFFEVFGDAQLAHLFYQPESSRLITVANLASGR
ncbi:MAG TPA: DUF4352 domain-containing protein, partial [Thermomicrobiales bacterium]|nr:DUF4352 domain-containing protein [Thermomicrobiales bacterium]